MLLEVLVNEVARLLHVNLLAHFCAMHAVLPCNSRLLVHVDDGKILRSQVWVQVLSFAPCGDPHHKLANSFFTRKTNLGSTYKINLTSSSLQISADN